MKKYHLGLIILLGLSLSACEQKTISCHNPSFPLPSDEVADELEAVCMPSEKCNAFWDWLDELYKLKDQLEN